MCGYSLLQRDFSYFVPLVIGLLGCNENTAVVAGDEILGLVRPEHYPLLLNRLKQLAGDGAALNCGMVGNLETPDAASKLRYVSL